MFTPLTINGGREERSGVPAERRVPSPSGRGLPKPDKCLGHTAHGGTSCTKGVIFVAVAPRVSSAGPSREEKSFLLRGTYFLYF